MRSSIGVRAECFIIRDANGQALGYFSSATSRSVITAGANGDVVVTLCNAGPEAAHLAGRIFAVDE